MSWIIWTLLGTFFGSLERIIDKKIVIGNEEKLDGLVASFYRNLAFYIFIILFGIIGVFGKINMFFAWPIMIWALFHILESVIYDYFLKNSEVVRYNGIVFIFPLILILADNYLFKTHYSLIEFIGFFLLIFGGYIISFDAKNRRNVYSKKQWFFLLIAFIISGAEFFIFKYYNNTLNINAVSFYASTWIFVILFFLIGIFLKNKQKLLIETAKNNSFFGKTLISKFFDSLSGLFILIAISQGTISKVYSLESISPIITFLLVLILVKITKINLKESFDRQNMIYKLIGVIILAIGSYLII